MRTLAALALLALAPLSAQAQGAPQSLPDECLTYEEPAGDPYSYLTIGGAWPKEDNGAYVADITFPATHNGRPVVVRKAVAPADANGQLFKLTIPEGTALIEADAFKEVPLSSVTLCERLSLMPGAFAYQQNLTELTVPNGVTYALAFSHCEHLRTVTFAEGATDLGFGCDGCTALERLVVPTSATSFNVIVINAPALAQELDLSHTQIVNWADNAAFINCPITQVKLPATIRSLGKFAFKNCQIASLDNVANLHNLQGTFQGFAGNPLTEVELWDGITALGQGALQDCKKLTTVTLNEHIEKLPDQAFKGCAKLTEVEGLNQVTELGQEAFAGCVELSALPLPSTVKSIGERCFDGCAKLTTLNSAYPDQGPLHFAPKVSYGKHALRGCGFTRLTLPSGIALTPGLLQNNLQLRHLSVPEGVATLPSYLCWGCEALARVDLPISLTSIADGAFRNCALAEVTLPRGLLSIGANAFDGCQLTAIEWPASLATVGKAAFGGNAFKTLTVAAVPAFTTEPAPQEVFRNCQQLRAVTLDEGITTVGERLFADCPQLETVTMPSTLTLIQVEAFLGTPGAAGFALPVQNKGQYWIKVMRSGSSYQQLGYPEQRVEAFPDIYSSGPASGLSSGLKRLQGPIPSALWPVRGAAASGVAVCDMCGRPIPGGYRGLCIERLADGTARLAVRR